jgi:integrase
MIVGWLNFPRPKTSVARRAKLWPETIAALKAAIDERPEPKDEAHRELVFITRIGKPWAKDTADSPITKEFAKVLRELKLTRAGLGFYALRHTTETVGGGAKDQIALDHVMGHAPLGSDMAAVYRERVDDERLIAIANHIYAWLFPRRKAK